MLAAAYEPRAVPAVHLVMAQFAWCVPVALAMLRTSFWATLLAEISPQVFNLRGETKRTNVCVCGILRTFFKPSCADGADRGVVDRVYLEGKPKRRTSSVAQAAEEDGSDVAQAVEEGIQTEDLVPG